MSLFERGIMFARKIYVHIPISLLNFIAPLFYLIPPKIRYGDEFRKTWNLLEKQDENISLENYENIVNTNFKNLMVYVYEHVPYYKRIMDERNLTPKDFSSIHDIEKLPFLTSKIIREEGEKLLSDEFNKKYLIKKQTSGSTGNPKEFYFDKSSEMREWAYGLHLWKRVGYTWNSSRLVLRAKKFRAMNYGKLWQWDAARKELSIDIHSMKEENCKIYCEVIEKYKPDFIYGYPSAIYQLCKYIEDNPIQHKFKAILLASESVSSEVRNFLEQVLKIRCFAFYGHTERAVIAGECEFSSSYHVEPSYGYIELIDKEGQIICNENQGEIIATGFTNKVMPLIRYRTGDLAYWDLDDCPCGRYCKKIKKIEGRTADFLLDRDGELFNVTSLHYEYFGNYNVEEFQFALVEKGIAEVDLIVNKNFSEKDRENIFKILQEDSKGLINFKIRCVNRMIIGANGKKRLVISKICNQ